MLALADVDECNTVRGEILKIKPGQKDTATRISDWSDKPQKKNELTDDALKSHFYDSLHPAILYHIHNCVMQRQSLSTNLTSHIVELRHIDAVLRSGNSRCRSDTSPVSTSHLKNLLATTSIAIPITLSAGDPMVLSASNLERNIT